MTADVHDFIAARRRRHRNPFAECPVCSPDDSRFDHDLAMALSDPPPDPRPEQWPGGPRGVDF